MNDYDPKELIDLALEETRLRLRSEAAVEDTIAHTAWQNILKAGGDTGGSPLLTTIVTHIDCIVADGDYWEYKAFTDACVPIRLFFGRNRRTLRKARRMLKPDQRKFSVRVVIKGDRGLNGLKDELHCKMKRLLTQMPYTTDVTNEKPNSRRTSSSWFRVWPVVNINPA